MRSAAGYLGLACFVCLLLALQITGGSLLPGPPVAWFVLSLVFFALAGLLLAVAGIRFFEALAEAESRKS